MKNLVLGRDFSFNPVLGRDFFKNLVLGRDFRSRKGFSKTFLVTKRVAVGAFGAFPLRIAVIFHADADFEVKSGVDSYF